MNIANQFKKWFFQEENVGIINIGDIIQIPGREYFKDDSPKLAQIDAYKEEYLQILSQRKLVSSKEISLDNLEKEIKMNTDLILHIIMHINDNPISSNNITNKINIIKLNLYLQDINYIENDLIIKLIALKELQKGKRVPTRNKLVLNEKINQLTVSIITTVNRKIAVEKEIYTHNLNMKIDKTSMDTGVLLNQKYQNILSLAETYINRDRLNMIINNNNVNIYTKIALLEKELEVYIYQHKEELALIKKELSTIDINEIYKLKNLEKRYMILDTYGRNIITSDDWLDFYKVKFNALTNDLIDNDDFENIEFNDREQYYYQEIIMKKITDIIMGNNHNIEKIFKEDAKEAIRLINTFLRNKDNKLEPQDIINDRCKLAFLLSFDTIEGLNYFYKNYLVESNLRHSLLSSNLKFCDKLPIETIYNIRTHEYSFLPSKYTGELYFLYKLLEKHLPYDENYYFPSGITDIFADDLTCFENTFAYNKINYDANNKIVVMPKTLKTICGNIFRDANINGIVLNDGLERIEFDALGFKKVKLIKLPSSLKQLRHASFGSAKAITFKDYKNSGILNNYQELENLIDSIYRISYIVGGETIPVHKAVLDIGYKEKFIIHREYVSVMIYSIIDYIFLEENDHIVACINKLPLLFIDRFGQYKESSHLKDEEIEKIIDDIKTLVKEKTGYELALNTNNAKYKKKRNIRKVTNN